MSILISACEVLQPASAPEPPPAPPPPAPEVVSCAAPEPCNCPEPQVVKVPVPIPLVKPCKAGVQALLILGDIEWVYVGAELIKVKARIDTGAKTSSLHAEGLTEFERDGKAWVRFDFDAEEGGQPTKMERRIVRRVRIKGHGGESQRRLVVKMLLGIGDVTENVDVTLSDRSDYEFPVLIGRNFLTDNAMVDVSKKFVGS